MLQQPRLVLVDGQCRGGVPGGNGDKAVTDPAVGQAVTDLRCDIVQGDAGGGGELKLEVFDEPDQPLIVKLLQ